MHRVKNFVIIVLLLIIAVLIGHCNLMEEEQTRLWDRVTMQREVLKMASQALTPEDRLRVVDQASLSGDSREIDSLKWEFVSEFPMFRDFEPDVQTYSVNVWRGQ